ncbi:hypothetical protein C8J57DRAFT_1533618 [Mycena rebaudengoi]|nr:hypothetical protein C8J57DRAFT_1533618 [Mycena rebaudengoi]
MTPVASYIMFVFASQHRRAHQFLRSVIPARCSAEHAVQERAHQTTHHGSLAVQTRRLSSPPSLISNHTHLHFSEWCPPCAVEHAPALAARTRRRRPRLFSRTPQTFYTARRRSLRVRRTPTTARSPADSVAAQGISRAGAQGSCVRADVVRARPHPAPLVNTLAWLLVAVCAFANPHAVELTLETYHAEFLSGVLPALACLRALVDLRVMIIAACTRRHLRAADVVRLCMHATVAPGPRPQLIGAQTRALQGNHNNHAHAHAHMHDAHAHDLDNHARKARNLELDIAHPQRQCSYPQRQHSHPCPRAHRAREQPHEQPHRACAVRTPTQTYERFESSNDKDVADDDSNDSNSGHMRMRAGGSRWWGGGGGKVECSNCGATHTPLWRRGGLYCKLHKRPRPKTIRSVGGGGESRGQSVRATSVAAETPIVRPGVSRRALPAPAPHSSSGSSASLSHRNLSCGQSVRGTSIATETPTASPGISCRASPAPAPHLSSASSASPHCSASSTLVPDSTTTQISCHDSARTASTTRQSAAALRNGNGTGNSNNGGSGPKSFHNPYHNDYTDAPPFARIDVSVMDRTSKRCRMSVDSALELQQHALSVLDVPGRVFDGVVAVFDGGVPVQPVPGGVWRERGECWSGCWEWRGAAGVGGSALAPGGTIDRYCPLPPSHNPRLYCSLILLQYNLLIFIYLPV